MKSFEAIPVIESRCAKIEKHYTNVLEDFDAEEIHQLRLNVKKLNAFLHLLNASRKTKKELRLFKRLHAFYKAVGSLRNLQLHGVYVLHLCTQQGLAVPQRYLQTIQQKENEKKKAIGSAMLCNPLPTGCRKLIKAAPATVTAKTVENFVVASKHRLFKLLFTGSYDDECLHSIRKLLKGFLYLWPWVKNEMDILWKSLCTDKDDCEVICETLGDFQDCCTALRLFDEYITTDEAHSETATLQALKQKGLDEKLRLKKEIVSHLRSGMNQHWERDVHLRLYEYF